MNPASPANSESDRGRLAAVLDEIRARRAAGESLPDRAVLEAHPELAPALAAELRKLGMIQQARRRAGESGASAAGVRAGAESAARLAPDSIAGYELLGELRRGTQGVVYRAVQKSTRRNVAIKVMRQGPFADADDRRRFDREVRVLSALEHPNIVSILDSGVAGGHSFFVMDYIEGEPLDSHVENHRGGVNAVLRLFVKICDAVGAAQVRGVIHRDLKPGNIRIDRRGEPHVLDFGLAKIDPATAVRAGAADAGPAPAALESSGFRDASAFTETGRFLGSLPWASPEQAEGLPGNVDGRTDVYSLGVMLFQSLTGRFPYSVAGSFRAVLDNIQNAAPARPGSIRREINDEVETIVLKCLQKDRERRYQSAGELSADLGRYLRGEPIDAKRDSHLYILRKQLRRYRVPLFAALAVVLSLAIGIVATTRATWRARRAEADALAFAHAESRLRSRADWELYRACLAASDAALIVNDVVIASARLDAAPAELRGWEWRYLHGRLDQSLAAYAVEGPIVERFALRPDGLAALAAVRGGMVQTVDPRSGAVARRAALPSAEITTLALSLDGRRLALALDGGEVSVCDAADGRELLRFRAHAGGATSTLALSPDGALLASGPWSARDHGTIRLWDAETGQARGALDAPDSWTAALAFGRNGCMLASGHTKPKAGVRVWDVHALRCLFSIDYEGFDVTHVEFSPDGGRIAVASQDSAIRLYDGASGHEVQTLAGHTARVEDVSFSSDGTRLASVSGDQTVRLWEAETGRMISCRRGHRQAATQVEFLPGDAELLTLSAGESALRRWDTAPLEEPQSFDTGKYFVLSLAFSGDGRRLFTHQRCWDTATGRELARLAPRDGFEANGWLTPDGSVEWATAGESGALFRRGATVMRTAEPLQFRPIATANGGLVAIGLKRGVLRVSRTIDGAQVCEVPIETTGVGGAAFSHSGEKLVTWSGDGRWTIWDVATGRPLIGGRHGTQDIVNIAFSADDALLATASYDGAAHICDAATGRDLHVLRAAGAPTGDQGVVWSVAFSPDGTRLATGSKDRRIRLWDVATGKELMALKRHAGTVMCLAWSPDGTQLASGGFEGAVCVWDSLSRAERHARIDAEAGSSAAHE